MALARYTATHTSNRSQGCVRVSDTATATVLTSLVARTSSAIDGTHFRRDDCPTSRFGLWRVLAYRREDGARHRRVVAARSENGPHGQWSATVSASECRHQVRRPNGPGQEAHRYPN